MEEISWKLLESIGLEVGLPLLGGFNLTSDNFNKEKKRLSVWQEKGFSGEMKYMNRSPDLLGNPKMLLPEAESILTFGLPYDSSPHPEMKVGYGRVARYAWGKDYHDIFPGLLKNFLNALAKINSNIKYKYFSDAVPLLERACAEKGGIGFVGKNTLIIKPGVGSFFFLGEILLNFKITEAHQDLQFQGCRTCTNCLEKCPTGAFEEECLLNANKCISYLTIEKKGLHSVREREMIGEWIFGCDICQEVCPFNHTSIKFPKAPKIEFLGSEGAGPLVSIIELLKIKTDEEFRFRFKGTPLIRPKREGMIRNAIQVAVNTRYEESLIKIIELINDASPVIRATALWGVYSLAGREKVLSHAEKAVHDISQEVAREAENILSGSYCKKK